MKKKGVFAKHAKSSAMLVSLVLHGILLLVALTFVAVTVVTKEEQKFEAKPVNRPKMQLKKLQVPVNVKKKKTQKPKLRKRIVVKPKMTQSVPDIKMPEITGVKGGLGNAGGGLGGGSGLGFSMPEIEIFGTKSQGEKIFIILEASGHMMVDEIGGIPAYTIIKSELVRILEELNPTILFNIAVYGGGDKMLFPQLVPASAPNVEKVKQWLEPLNAVSKGMGDKDYGAKTIGPGGIGVPVTVDIKPLKSRTYDWATPAMEAMKQQADVVFVLSCRWGHQAYIKGEGEKWSESQMKRWDELVAKAKDMLKEENEKRRAAGQPPRVITHADHGLVQAYFPGEPLRPLPEYGWYTPKEMIEALTNKRAEYAKDGIAVKSGLSNRNSKNPFTLNVIHFTRENDGKKEERFLKITGMTRGDYSQIKGMTAIKSYVSSGE